MVGLMKQEIRQSDGREISGPNNNTARGVLGRKETGNISWKLNHYF